MFLYSDKKKGYEDTSNSTVLTEYDYVSQDNNKQSDTTMADPEKEGTKKGGKDTSSTPIVDWSRSRAFLRELDFDVFSVLGCGLVSKTILDTEMNTKVG